LIPSLLVAASAAILFAFSFLHLVLTFRGPKLWPRDRELKSRMEAVSPVLTTETTIWKCWIGFNASHSLCGMLFGAVYGYLALAQPALLFRSFYLPAVGALLLLSYVFLGAKYWFRVPFRGILAASICYAAGFTVALLS
jgi:hypothetical protein